jgi:hypothetical protein
MVGGSRNAPLFDDEHEHRCVELEHEGQNRLDRWPSPVGGSSLGSQATPAIATPVHGLVCPDPLAAWKRQDADM